MTKFDNDDFSFRPYKAEKADGDCGNWLYESEVEPATKAEFDAQTSQLPKPDESETVTHKGREYRKVSRKAVAGELVVITANTNSHEYEVGAIVMVAERYDNGGKAVGVDTNAPSGMVRDSDYLTLEPMQSADPRSQFATGDKVRLISGGGHYPLYGFVNDRECSVTNPLYPGHQNERIEIINGSSKGYAKPHQLVKVTEPDRFKTGGYVKVVDLSGGIEERRLGHVAEITEDDGSSIPYRIRFISDGRLEWVRAICITGATAEEVAAARYAAKIGDFKAGDWAVIESPTDQNADYNVRAAKGQTVTVEPYGPEGHRGLTLRSADGARVGYANASALRKVDEPKPTFNVGDKVRLLSGAGQRCLHGFTNGETCTVIGKLDRDGDVRVSNGLVRGYTKPEQIALLATAEEGAPLAESAKWAAIGRKVGEYKAGDIVEITANTNHSVNKVGAIGTVVGEPSSSGSYRVNAGYGETSNWTRRGEMKLVTPVEKRFDTVA